MRRSQLSFLSPSEFAPAGAYHLLPFRFARLSENRILITSEAGEFLFLEQAEFSALVAGTLDYAAPIMDDLIAKHFLYYGTADTAVRLSAAKLRTRKSFLRGGPSLHIFVVTLGCDHSCGYCQVSRRLGISSKYTMTEDMARAAVDRLFEAPATEITVEFQGGEPLLAFDGIRFITELIQSRKAQFGKNITFCITTTLHHLTDESLAFFKEHDFQISTSVDGPPALHNANRLNSTFNSYERTRISLDKARSVLGEHRISALVTVTRRSLDMPEDIVDEYVALGFRSIFLRPLALYGFAVKAAVKLSYSPSAFQAFYGKALTYILELNRSGTNFSETYAGILLSTILTPFPQTYMDLRSPVGAGFGTIVYNYDGGVFASDEARMLEAMGRENFKLGSVFDRYEDLIRSEAVQRLAAAGLAEALPGCSDCAFLPYCGPDPLSAMTLEGDPVGHRASSLHCTRHMGLFHFIFETLARADRDTLDILLSWVPGHETMQGH